MTRENCSPHLDNLAAYSLYALGVEEIPALETHLKTCQECQLDLTDYQKITTGLLQATAQKTPPARLRQKLAHRLPSAQNRTSSLPVVSFKQFATALVFATLLGLNIFSAIQIHDLQQQQKILAESFSTEQTTLGMLAHPGTQLVLVSADLPEMTGSMVLDRDKNTAVLVLWNLPELDAGQTYQIWLINARGERISGGLFNSSIEWGYTTASIRSTLPLGEFVAIGVTIEPSGGSDQPTGSRVLVVNL